MKYLHVLILLLLSTPCFAKLTAVEQLQENTVVITDTRGHVQGHGSGVLFTRVDGDRVTTFVWTAAHVANIFMNRNGTFREVGVIQGDKRAIARVIRSGDDMLDADCALLEIVSGDDFNGITRFYRGFNHIKVGQKVVHCGTPCEILNERLVSFGQVSFVDRLFDDPRSACRPRLLNHVDITAYSGCSGGPVVDEETYDIIGLLIKGSAPRLTVIETTRGIYDWSKAHDCMWAFDRDVDLPRGIVAWRGDMYNRHISGYDTRDLDDRWGELPPELEVEIIRVNLDELLELVQDLLGVVLKKTLVIASPISPLDPPLCEYPIGLNPGGENTSPGFLDPRTLQLPDPPAFEVPPLETTLETDIRGITIEEDVTVIVRDADGNIIKVIDSPRDPFNMSTGIGYQCLLST